MSFDCYQGAAVLNNIGVLLLQQGCYQQAASTFQDAVTVLRGADVPGPPLLSLQDALCLALLRLQQPYHDVSEATLKVEPIHTLSSTANLEQVIGSSAIPAAAPGVVSPVFFESLSSQPAVLTAAASSDDIKYGSALILLNLGTAFYCVSSAVAEPLLVRQAQEEAMKLFHLSYALLSNLSTIFNEDTIKLARILRTAVVVLRSLGQAATAVSDLEQSLAVVHRLSRITSVLRDLEKLGALGTASAEAMIFAPAA